jgi:hypothetical protein
MAMTMKVDEWCNLRPVARQETTESLRWYLGRPVPEEEASRLWNLVAKAFNDPPAIPEDSP